MIFDQIINSMFEHDKIGDISKWTLYNENGLATCDLNQMYYSEGSNGYDLYLYSNGTRGGWNANYVLTTFMNTPLVFYISVHAVNRFTKEEFRSDFKIPVNITEEQYFQQSLLDDICLELTTLNFLQEFMQTLIQHLRPSGAMRIL